MIFLLERELCKIELEVADSKLPIKVKAKQLDVGLDLNYTMINLNVRFSLSIKLFNEVI